MLLCPHLAPTRRVSLVCAQGAGFLGVPKAFFESGFILGPVLLLFCACVCDFTKNMVLEAMARAEAVTEVCDGRRGTCRQMHCERLTRARACSYHCCTPQFRLTDAGALTVGVPGPSAAVAPPSPAAAPAPHYQKLPASAASHGTVQLHARGDGDGAATAGTQSTTAVVVRPKDAIVSVAGVEVTPRTQVRVRNAWRPRYRITARKFEVTELCELFLGRPGKLMCVWAQGLCCWWWW